MGLRPHRCRRLQNSTKWFPSSSKAPGATRKGEHGHTKKDHKTVAVAAVLLMMKKTSPFQAFPGFSPRGPGPRWLDSAWRRQTGHDKPIHLISSQSLPAGRERHWEKTSLTAGTDTVFPPWHPDKQFHGRKHDKSSQI